MDTLGKYLEEIGHIPLLSVEEERELAMRIERGDEDARRRLIEANLRLVVNIAKRYVRSGIPIEDLIQEGNLGLIRAAEKFDWRRGYKFSTYATIWIHQAIRRGIANRAGLVRIPVHGHDVIARLKRARRLLEQELAHEPSIEEIAASAGVDPDLARDLLNADAAPFPLDIPIDPSGTETLSSFLPDSREDPEESAVRSSLRRDIELVLTTLSPREQAVIRMRFGLDDNRPRTLQEIGRIFGLTRERIRQIELKAIRKLRHPSRRRRLRAYL